MDVPVGKLSLVIQSLTRETPDIVSYKLCATNGVPLRAFTPGAHLDLWLPGGVVRQYAISSRPDDLSHYRISAQIHPEGRASSFLRSGSCVGRMIEATGPRDTFGFRPAPHYQFVAGGIGIVSILPMLYAATTAGATWQLHYFVDDKAAAPFRDELSEFGDSVILYTASEGNGRTIANLLPDQTAGTRLYCCGPNTLMLEIEEATQAWQADQVKFEWFVKRQIASPPSKTIHVRCVRSDVTIDVPAGQSILDAVLAAGINVPNSCREGTCATCAVRVLRGNPDHRDSVLNDTQRAAGKIMMICVSRAHSDDLELDL